jgi:predicted TIM-barrel fold metal-dependent hydrolase
VAEWIRLHPDRFAGLAAVNLLKPMEAVRELRRCINGLGFKGLRIVQWLWNLPATDRHYYPLFAECVNLGVPVCLQVGHTGPLCPSEPGRPIPYIDEVALAFPELVMVCGHIGYPWTQEMIAVATKHPNVYIDTSAYKAKRFPAELVSYMRGNGSGKVLFGTNYPMMTPQMAFDGLESLGLSEEQMNRFLYENALRIFSL